MREGNLEAPTRHPIDWKNPDFYDEAAAFAEMERVFDICHGCRRCVSLCQSFPNLFDLVDATADGEVHGVKKADYWKVVDQCYLCDLCYMTKCPYTPPHAVEPGLPAPDAARQGDQVQARARSAPGEKFLASTDVHGQFAGIPIVVQVVNAVNTHAGRAQADGQRARRAPRCLDARAGDAALPLERAKNNAAPPVVNGERTPGKVAIFATCYVNYNEPGIGHDLLKLLEHNEIPYEIVEKESAAACPSSSSATWRRWSRHKDANIPVLAKYAREGYAIVTRGAQLHADVQAGAAADVPRRRRHAARQGGDVRPLRVPGRAPQGRPAEDRLQGARWARSATTSPATAGCRTSARRPRRCSS